MAEILSNKQRHTNRKSAVGAETTLKTRENQKILKSRGIKTFLTATLGLAMLIAANICSYGQELRPVKGLNGKWGFVDKTGKEVISFKYEAAQEFSEGLAAVNLKGYWGFIDTTGKKIIPFTFWAIGNFSEGLAAARYFYGGSGFIDKAGKEVILFEFQWVGDFSEGLAAVQRNNKWGAIDKNGTMVVPCIYGNMHNAVIAGKKEKKAQEEEKAAALERERIALEREKAEKEAQEKDRLRPLSCLSAKRLRQAALRLNSCLQLQARRAMNLAQSDSQVKARYPLSCFRRK